ncbi:hypothetical protein SAY86_005695 [Trapa natans]|uniref:Homeobox domain-containing protein n=1 Tax=Trapa natans TaxID=22666 RepID=A0AAN7L9Q9_TRANT|nr:hypothetical protein SAY86_005695 [Trapa natans]
MELSLSLRDTSKPFSVPFLGRLATPLRNNKELEFRMGLDMASEGDSPGGDDCDVVPLQLELLPFSPVLCSSRRLPWLDENIGLAERDSARELARCLDESRFSAAAEEPEDGGAHSSPNSAVSSFHMDFWINNGLGGGRSNNSNSKRYLEVEADRVRLRGSDDDESGLNGRKKLRLSKAQSAFLEESFKEHSTLNPKQKLALANQLNLRPRQVEVWFQNRRARTKLKQTEIDCEHLKRCCETLTEENRRLKKELQELRALKTSQPFYRKPPATTLTMCPSCERVSTASTSNTTSAATAASLLPAPPRVHPLPPGARE